MLELVIDNSESHFVKMNKTHENALRSLLSFVIPPSYGRSKYSSLATYKSLLTKQGRFPTGLLPRIQKYLDSQPLGSVKITDVRKVPRPEKRIIDSRFPYKPYHEQIIAAKACKRAHRGVIVAPTGVGKSAIIALIIRELQVKTLVVVPSLELKRQLIKSLEEIYPWGVGPEKQIWVENIDALRRFKSLEGIDCLIIDEFHHSAAETYKKMNKTIWKDIYYRFGLTATFFRALEHENIYLESILSEVLYTIKYEDAVDKEYIVPLDVYSLNGFIPGKKIDNKDFKVYSHAYKELIVQNETRNLIISDTLLRLYQGKVSTLCLVKEIEHGNRLKELTGLPFANGESNDCKDLIKAFNEGKIKVLIGTTGVLGEGVDTKPCEYVLIATPIKSRALFMQGVGRGFRKFPGKETCKLILIEDNSHRWFKAAYKEQVLTIKEEYNRNVIKLV